MTQMRNKYLWAGIATLPKCPMLLRISRHQNWIQSEMWLVLLQQTLSTPLQAS